MQYSNHGFKAYNQYEPIAAPSLFAHLVKLGLHQGIIDSTGMETLQLFSHNGKKI